MHLIGDALSDPTRTRFFTEIASDREWIGWLDVHQHLDRLFVTSTPNNLGECDSLLAWWLAERFTHDQANELFLLMAEHDMRLHPTFWTVLCQVIGLKTDRPLNVDTLAKWVSLLLAAAPSGSPTRPLSWLGERCIEAGMTGSLMDIFGALIPSRLVIKQSYAAMTDGRNSTFTADFASMHEHYDLKNLWEKGLMPNLGEVVEPLLTRVTDHLAARNRTLRAWQSMDRESYRRSAIEPHEQDRHPQVVDILIDVARDCLQHLARTQPKAAANWCDRLIQAEAPLLRRLAIHTLARRHDLAADAKAEWLLVNVGLHYSAAHHETYRAVRTIYPNVSLERRQAIIEAAVEYAWTVEYGWTNVQDEDGERFVAYKHFKWLYWLQESDPNCELTKRLLDELLARYPGFQPRDHPDLTHHMIVSRLIGFQSPYSVEELLERPAREWADELLAFQEENPFGPSRSGLLRNVEQAATQRFEWGLQLAAALFGSDNWDTDLWAPLMEAWSREVYGNNHEGILDWLDKPNLYPKHARSIANTLYMLVKDRDSSYARDSLLKANRIASALWHGLSQDEPPSEMNDWFVEAKGNTAGILADFWLHSLALWRKQPEAKSDSLNDAYSRALSTIIEDETLKGRFGKSILASQLDYLIACDENWTSENLIPLFYDHKGSDYRATWDGFLCGRLSPQVANALEGAFLEAVLHMDELFPSEGEQRRQFVEIYALMLTYFVDDPLILWVPRFFENAQSQDRDKFHQSIEWVLDGMKETDQQAWWERWLRSYWENRLDGVPVALDNVDVLALLNWLPCFAGLFSEAVDLAIQMPSTPFDHNLIIHRIEEGQLWVKYPEATAKLLVYMANVESPLWAWEGAGKIIEGLLRLNLPEGLKTKLEELPARLGL